jgi:heat shock protein HslJ
MKTFYPILLILTLVISSSCDKSNNDLNLDTIVNTQWTLSKIIDNQTGEITEFPVQIDKFHIIFKQYGIIELPDYCNYSFGTYSLINDDSLIISNVGPGTEKYCLPDLAMDWETLFINSLRKSETHSVMNNHLTVNSSGDYDLVFDFVESFDSYKGKLLFYTNSQIINCPFAIEISLNNTIIDTLTAASTYSDTSCYCDNQTGIGLIKDIASGSYIFHASEINCSSTNRVNSWTGDITIINDSCSVIFFDVIE